MAVDVETLLQMGRAWAEERWAVGPGFGQFDFCWAYAALANDTFDNEDVRTLAAETICDAAQLHWTELELKQAKLQMGLSPKA